MVFMKFVTCLGAVELEKLPLKKDALKKLKLPIEVKSGFIGKLKIEIPFRRLKSQPWVVQVDQLYLVAGPSAVSPVSCVCVCVCVSVCVHVYILVFSWYYVVHIKSIFIVIFHVCGLVQMVERLLCKQEVLGLMPRFSIVFFLQESVYRACSVCA